MKNKRVLVLMLFLGTTMYSFGNKGFDSTQNSIGLDYRFQGGRSPNIGITYRRTLQSIPLTLRANFNIGSIDYFGNGFSYLGDDLLIFNTSDSLVPIIGVNSLIYQNSSYQRIELGIEKNIRLWKFNLIAGADLIVGHRVSSSFGRVVEAELGTVEKNGISYQKYQAKTADSLSPPNDLNHLNSQYNYLTVGGNLRLGFKVDLSDRLFATAFLGYRLQQEILIRESFDYKNDSFKDHLPSNSGGDFFTVNSFSSIGLHYKF